jgi:hypothetical protein
MCEADAQVCERQAQLLKEPEARAAYLECAKTWRRMACELETIEKAEN